MTVIKAVILIYNNMKVRNEVSSHGDCDEFDPCLPILESFLLEQNVKSK